MTKKTTKDNIVNLEKYKRDKKSIKKDKKKSKTSDHEKRKKFAKKIITF